jgi:hypothetical protein
LALENKVLQLAGGPSSAVPPGGRNAYGWHIAEGRPTSFWPIAPPPVMRRKKIRTCK